MCVLLPSVKHIRLGDIDCVSLWFQHIYGRDIQRAIERVELVLSQEEMDKEDLEG